MSEIIIRINPTGDTTVTVEGIKGISCTDITKALEKALGGDIISSQNTLEYYEEEVAINVDIEK